MFGNYCLGYLGQSNWGGLAMGLFMVIIPIIVILLVVRYLDIPGRKASFATTPLEILKKRYANGEISRQEFSEMKKDLHE
ncbi:SHOCT domain-containing protein [uncultured Sphaerochaeta sp.]|uniref:SHOCT domain-containing protein n=1 Tax=uncultured Sphaerochaeta sp. TaxID=886478 RepID=UPI002A0A922C|nr:SHOCT domain-containing protein [uncultured Sphaerochaeta sp.]